MTQSANDIVAVHDKLYFTSVFTLYASDGTPAGTRVLVAPDPLASYYFDPLVPLRSSLTKLGDTLYLQMQQGTTNSEPHTLTEVPSTIVGRHLYYNNSKFDENTPGVVPPLDDLAIATDKSPYFAGTGTATFENISSYSRGINGVMIDIAGRIPDGLLGTLSANDFQFRMGTGNDPNSWTNAPAPQSFWKQEKTGEGGDFTRVYFTWAEGAVKNTWLEITVLANGRTGLYQPDVFYFGNRVGDTGSGSPTAAVTSAADELAARFAPGFNQPITSLVDFDRNGVVNAGDALIARNNVGVLLKLNLPGPAAAAPLAVLDDDDDRLTSLAEPLAAWTANSQTAAPLAAQPANVPSRGELLAYALQSWTDLLDADEDEELIGGLFAAPWARR